MATSDIKRRLAFSAWQPASQGATFDRIAVARQIGSLRPDELICEKAERLTAVRIIAGGSDTAPTRLQVLALHDETNRPTAWAHDSGVTTIELDTGVYTAFASYVALYQDKIVVHDDWANSPGLGRLATFIADKTDQRVLFRRLYHPSLAEQLEDLQGWRGIDFSIHDPHKLERASGLNLFSRLSTPRVPSIRVSLGMGRKGPRDAYLEPGLVEELLGVADRADEFFDTLVIRGHSRTQLDHRLRPRLITVNVLNERLLVEAHLKRDDEARNLPTQAAAFSAFDGERDRLRSEGLLERAVEARFSLPSE